jgi:hypothetical protein
MVGLVDGDTGLCTSFHCSEPLSSLLRCHGTWLQHTYHRLILIGLSSEMTGVYRSERPSKGEDPQRQ